MNRLKRHAAAWGLALSALLPMTAGAAAGDPLGPEFALGSGALRTLRWSDDGQLLAVVSGNPSQVRRLSPDGQLLSSHPVESGCAFALDGAGGVVRVTLTNNIPRGMLPLVQVYWPDGNPRTGPFRVDSQQNTPFAITCPSIAANAAGNFVVGWGKYSQLNLDEVTAPTLNAIMTGPVGDVVQDLNLTPLLQLLLCCRIPPYLGPSAAYVRAYSPDGVPLREPRMLSARPDLLTPGQADQRVSHGPVAINRSGESAAGWIADLAGLTQAVSFQRHSASGSGSGLPKTIYLQERIAKSWPMALGDDGSLYTFSTPGLPNLVVYDRSNRRRQEPLPLDDSGLIGTVIGIGLAADPQGEVLVAWTKSYYQQHYLLGRRFDRDGSPKGPSFLISDNSVITDVHPDPAIPPVVSVSATGVFAVGWTSWAGARGRLYQGR
jgi:hypothetical protein